MSTPQKQAHLIYKKVRTEGKKFYILSWSKTGTWEWGLQRGERVLYKLPEVLNANKIDKRVFVVEGEKDVERLRLEGLVATTPIKGVSVRHS